MRKQLKSRPTSVLDEIDIRILHELLKKPYSILELVEKVGVTHQYIKTHLQKLASYNIIKIEQLKGRKLLVSYNNQYINISSSTTAIPGLGNIIYEIIKAGIVVKDIMKEEKIKKETNNPSTKTRKHGVATIA